MYLQRFTFYYRLQDLSEMDLINIIAVRRDIALNNDMATKYSYFILLYNGEVYISEGLAVQKHFLTFISATTHIKNSTSIHAFFTKLRDYTGVDWHFGKQFQFAN